MCSARPVRPPGPSRRPFSLSGPAATGKELYIPRQGREARDYTPKPRPCKGPRAADLACFLLSGTPRRTAIGPVARDLNRTPPSTGWPHSKNRVAPTTRYVRNLRIGGCRAGASMAGRGCQRARRKRLGDLIPKVGNTDPFHRDDFGRQLGARCAVVLAPQATRNAAGGQKRPALRVGRLGAPGALRRLPDAPHRAAHRAYPSDPIRSHEMSQYFLPLV